MIDDLPFQGPDGGVVLMRVAAGWTWLIAALGVAIVVVGGILLT